MAKFIKVHRRTGKTLLVNIEHIKDVWEDPEGNAIVYVMGEVEETKYELTDTFEAVEDALSRVCGVLEV